MMQPFQVLWFRGDRQVKAVYNSPSTSLKVNGYKKNWD